MQDHILYLDKPAVDFESGTPVGNGSMGAMLFGDPHHEVIFLSEETIWSGEKRDTTDPSFREKIDELRKMYLDGRLSEIDEHAGKILEQSIERVRSCEYAGRIDIDFDRKGKITDYSRKLNLTEGVAHVSYSNDNVYIMETAFSSYSYEITALRWSFGSESGFDLSFFRELTDRTEYKNGMLLCYCHTAYGDHKFCVGIRVDTDGESYYNEKNGSIGVDGATQATVFIAVCTEFNFGEKYDRMCREMLEDAEDYDVILKGHTQDFRELASSSDICFVSPDDVEALPADKRIERLRNDESARDDGLFALYFAFGKYLLISSSRDSTLPAHLQGVWVEKMENPWNADYHTNINLQMNYWLSEVANLSFTHLQLFDYMNNYLLESGMRTAKVNYGCRGTVEHHLSDLYCFTTPADGLWGVWPMGAAWLSFHMWEHYLYTLDLDYLKETAYEYMRQCALFFVDYMFEDKNGYLLTGPSMSPENLYYIEENGEKKEQYLSFSPTMDIEIVTGVLEHFIEAEKLLNIHPDERKEAEYALSKMPPLKIGKRGNLQEWMEDYDEPEPGHRHISHAFGLHPGNMITRKTPELFAAIEKTLELRLANGGGHTGWSRSWLICLFARLRNGAKCYENIRALLTKSTNCNLLDTHPPFQIDGNFGGASGIAESLIQSHEGFISLLPAACEGLTGSFSGLKARGNYEVSATFENGRLTGFEIGGKKGTTVPVEVPDGYECDLPMENGLYMYTIK